MKKMWIMLIMTCILLSASFGATSALTEGSAYTVMDDAYYVMDVLDWNKADFGKFFGFTAIDSNNTLNFIGAQHLKEGNLAYAYSGNLWGKDVVDKYSVFYGKKNMGFLFDLGTRFEDTGLVAGNTMEKYKYFAPEFTFGMKATDKFSFITGFGIVSRTGSTETDLLGTTVLTKASEIIPTFTLGGYYTIKNTSKLFARAGLVYTGSIATSKTKVFLDGEEQDPTKSSENSNKLSLNGVLEYKVTDRFTYGLSVTFPQLSFGGSKDAAGNETKDPTYMYFYVRNGFVAEIEPDRFLVSLGINTSLPRFEFEKDQDTDIGTLTNSYYMGMAFYLTPQIRIDGTTRLDPVAGISLDTIWNTEMALTVSIKL